MSDDKKYIILEDKFVDILMHTATRNDIAELRKEMHSEIKDVRSEIKDVRSEIKDVRSENRRQFYWLLGVLLPVMFGGFGSLQYQLTMIASKLH